jgi:TonB-dependent receptor
VKQINTVWKGIAMAVILFCFFIHNSSAQTTGDIAGNITDSLDAEGLIGAVVVIEGNTSQGAFTDLEGNFVIKKVVPGTYTIQVSYFGYSPIEVRNVTVTAGKTTNLGTLYMNATPTEGEEVIVTGTRTTNTEASVLREVKESQQVVSAISAEQISKSQDRDASQVMQRIPGVTIIDNRFVMVRGLAQRYNSVMLNDVFTPSSEVDEKAFSFDLVPSGMIDRIMVYKSGAPELPGDFAGAGIKVYTKNIPDENQTSLTISGSGRQGTTFNRYKSYQGSATDWLGFDNGNRSLPSDYPRTLNSSNVSNAENNGYAKSLNDNYSVKEKKAAMPDLRINFNMARKWNIGKRKFGSVTSINYSNTYQYQQVKLKTFLENYTTSTDDMYATTSRIGVIQNFSLNWNPYNRFTFKNTFNQIGRNTYSYRDKIDTTFNFVNTRGYEYAYESRSIYAGQLAGAHDSKNDKTTLRWVLGYAYTNKKEPDLRRVGTAEKSGEDGTFLIQIPPNASNRVASRFFSNLNEIAISESINLEHKLNTKKGDSSAITLRAGVYSEQKQRDFAARWFAYGVGNQLNFDYSLLEQSFDQVFSRDNMDPATGFRINEGTNSSDRYTASNFLLAPYVGTSIPFLKRFMFSGGIRVEYNHLQLESANSTDQPINLSKQVVSPLPSANLSYNLTEKSLVRVAYFRSINRQEFREVAPFQFYTFATNFDTKGNDSLKHSDINNFDLRWEYYPSPMEFISFGVFYKTFSNAIENTFLSATSRPIASFTNSDKAYSVGAEVEVRKSLSFVGVPVVKNMSVLLNASVIKSEVQFTKDSVIIQTQNSKRAMQGQSPYIINAGLYYFNEKSKLQVNLLYNVFGRRIFLVGGDMLGQPTTYEMPRNVIDLTLTKGFGKHWEVRAGIQDILNQKFNIVFDENNDGIPGANETSFREFRRGSYYTLGVGYKF